MNEDQPRVPAGSPDGGQWAGETPLYHGTKSPAFDKFDISKAGSQTDEGFLGRGVYLSTDPKVVKSDQRTVEARAEIRHPLKVEMKEWTTAGKPAIVSQALGLPATKSGADLTAELQRRGHDAVVLDYSKLGYNHKEVMVIDPAKVHIKK